jgi:hypothetical protein
MRRADERRAEKARERKEKALEERKGKKEQERLRELEEARMAENREYDDDEGYDSDDNPELVVLPELEKRLMTSYREPPELMLQPDMPRWDVGAAREAERPAPPMILMKPVRDRVSVLKYASTLSKQVPWQPLTYVPPVPDPPHLGIPLPSARHVMDRFLPPKLPASRFPPMPSRAQLEATPRIIT